MTDEQIIEAMRKAIAGDRFMCHRNICDDNDAGCICGQQARAGFAVAALAIRSPLVQQVTNQSAEIEALRAELGKAREALKGIAALDATGMQFGDQVFAVTSARAALRELEARQ